MMKRYFLIALLFLLSVGFVHAANFTASVSTNTVTVGQRFQLSFTLDDNGSNFKEPNLSDFNILGGPSQSTSMSIINGRRSQELTFTYILQAKREGSFTIKPATITVDGSIISSNSVTINVLPESEAQKEARRESQRAAQTLEQQAMKVIHDNIFIRVSLSKQTVYQGEQVVATYKLYRHPELRIADYKVTNLPSFEGFWAQQIETPNQNDWEVIDGTRYSVITLRKVVLYPQKTGNLQIEPFEYSITARLRVEDNSNRRDPFGSFFNRGNFKDFTTKVSSPAKQVKVIPFPSDAPESFAGAVGSLSMEAWFDNTVTATGQPISLKIKISGNGNLKLIDPIDIDLPPGFEMFDPKTADNTSVTTSGVSGSITFEYIMIPANAGNYKFGPIDFTYFDLKEKAFRTISSDEFTIEVKKGDGSGATSMISGVQKEDIELLGKDIRYIKRDAKLDKSDGKYFGTFTFALLNILPIAAFFTFIFVWRRRKAEAGDEVLMRKKRASKVAKKRLAQAGKYLSSADKAKFYEEIDRALWLYLSDKLAIPFAELTKSKAKGELLRRGFDSDLTSRLLNVMDECEYARYAPDSEGVTMDKVYNDAVSVITEMEGKLK